MSSFQVIEALCCCIERLLGLIKESAEAAEIEREFREIIGEAE